VSPFDPGVDFLLIVHPREARNPVGTARMAHRFLRDSTWLECAGKRLDQNARFRAWLESRPGRVSVLYPGPGALAVKEWRETRTEAGAPARRAVIILDGTWAQARQMMRQSQLLQSLPLLSFQTERRSAYEIREQPRALCLSSLEAIHELLSQSQTSPDSCVAEGAERMLQAFLEMVRFQVAKGGPAQRKAAVRGVRRRI